MKEAGSELRRAHDELMQREERQVDELGLAEEGRDQMEVYGAELLTAQISSKRLSRPRMELYSMRSGTNTSVTADYTAILSGNLNASVCYLGASRACICSYSMSCMSMQGRWDVRPKGALLGC